MKANTTVQRINNLFQHPSARFVDTVGGIADQRITAYHTSNGNGLSSEEVTAIVQEIIAQQETPVIPADLISYGGDSAGPADTLLTADNLGKIFNITSSFTVPAGENGLFVETFDTDTVFPAGTDLLVVNAASGDEDPQYKFDILHGMAAAASTSGVLRFDSEQGSYTISIDPNESVDLKDTIAWRVWGRYNAGEQETLTVDVTNLCHLSQLDTSAIAVETIPAMEEALNSMVEGATFEGIDSVTAFVKC